MVLVGGEVWTKGVNMYPKFIVLHHSLTKDGSVVDWQAIRRYHTSWKCEGNIITHEEATKIIQENPSLPKEERRYVEAPWRDIGYHVGVELINDHYEILIGRTWDLQGAHCSDGGMNSKSLGICFVGNFDKAPPPDEQWNLGLKITRFLMLNYHISAENVVGHRKYSTKTCPGTQFDIERFCGLLI